MRVGEIILVGKPLPWIASVVADGGFVVRVTWRGRVASRTRKAEPIDLAPAIFTYKIYRPLRDNPRLFRSVHVVHDGNAIAWGAEDEIDMSAAMLERLADERMVKADFRAFMGRNKLTLDAAAAQLGISRRLAAYYASGERPVPRYIALACRSLDRRRGRLGGLARPERGKGAERRRKTGGRVHNKRGGAG
jgi:hypothetical protein